METVDIIALYWLILRVVITVTSVIIFLSSVDDLLIDIYYWVRKLFRAVFIRPRHPHMKVEELFDVEQQPIALMSPAWDEPAVIGKMVTRCIEVFDYDNFHIFIGTYPNDPATQAAVDEVVALYSNVHKVVGRKEGPTTKAECLNNIIRYIFDFEKANDITFQCIAYHDAEDVIHPLEMRLFNYLVPRKDLVQLPVLPLPRRWFDFIGNHYMDEFAESHGKDMVVRESFCGNVPSAGVATAFSRRALARLAELNNGEVFDESTLTEDYNIGYFLKEAGMNEIFARVVLNYRPENSERYGGMNKIIASGGYFPNRFYQSFRQKARWSTGIVFQGWAKLGWPKDIKLSYMLAHDRKGIITNFVPFVGYFIVLNFLVMLLITHYNADAWWFPPLVEYRSFTWNLLMVNGLLVINRIVQRFIFTTQYYGLKHGLLSLPRMVVANVINFFAMSRAIYLIVAARRSGTSVKWDKTAHEDEGEHGES